MVQQIVFQIPQLHTQEEVADLVEQQDLGDQVVEEQVQILLQEEYQHQEQLIQVVEVEEVMLELEEREVQESLLLEHQELQD
jgi:hypothetical protein